MAEKRYSRDIWDYLDDMPYMPSRKDRDALVEEAQKDPRRLKRVRIWDYLFRIKPEDVGKPQKRDIEELESQQRIEKGLLQVFANRWLLGVIVLLLVGLAFVMISCVILLLFSRELEWFFTLGISLVFIGVCVWFISRQIFEARLTTIDSEYQTKIDALQERIESLKKRIPSPPSDMQVHSWLQKDVDWLTRRAKEQTGLEPRLVDLKDAPNPLCILGPAELQDSKQIPKPFLDEHDDRAKHLTARRLAKLPNGRFEDFYGVYYIQFIFVAGDMLGSYGCFFDFITGKVVGEYTSEQYYHDVVSLSTRREYRQISILIGSERVTIGVGNIPTFGMTLTSGDDIEVTFASPEYFRGIDKQNNIAPDFDLEHWIRNPEIIANNAVTALRSRLRKHKGAP
jgi:hypothetical protein